jgi:hypothetical protein
MRDFPNSPTNGQTYVGPGNVLWQFDGVKWLASQGGGGVFVVISDTAPPNPAVGTFWWDSTAAQLFLFYYDGNSSQWVQANSLTADVGAALAFAQNNVGRNYLHNSRFNILQRGVGNWTVDGFGADRWRNGFGTTGGSMTCSINAVAANTAAGSFGDEACQNIWVGAHNAGTGAGDFFILRQFVENVRRYSGKTMTLSFWAWANSGTPKVCVELGQQFGTGGSPSASVFGIGMTPITINTTPTRYSVTFTVPSVAGATFGTNAGSDFMEVNLWFSAGTTYSASRAGGIGAQSNTFLVWGVQLEAQTPGQTAPSPLEKIDPVQDLQRCQRFYQTSGGNVGFNGWSGQVGNMVAQMLPFPVLMRTTPTITTVQGDILGAPNVVVPYVTPAALKLQLVANLATSSVYWDGSWTASADL